MAAPIVQTRRSSVAGKIPTTVQLSAGEFAVNTYDGKVYIKQDQGGVGVGTTVIVVNPWSVGLGSTSYSAYFTAGNVGVGITNPTTKLQVNGIIGFSDSNVKIGSTKTGQFSTSNSSNYIGVGAGYSDKTSSFNNFFGYYVGCLNTGSNNNFFGVCNGAFNTGCSNNFIGFSAGPSNTSGSYNNFFGNFAGFNNTSGCNNNYIGKSVGWSNVNGNNNNFFGTDAGCTQTTGDNNVAIGCGVQLPITTGSNQLIIGVGNTNWISGNNLFNVGIGTTNPTSKLQVNGDITSDNYTGKLLGTFNTNFFGGVGAGNSTTSVNNIFIGYFAAAYNTTGRNNIILGHESGYCNTSGKYNQFYGTAAGNYNTTGSYNNFFGSYTGISTSASYKVIIGSGYGYGNSLFDCPDTNKDIQFAVGVNTDTTRKYWLVGNENFNVGIGTTNPTSKLYVAGNVNITGVVTAASFVGNGSGLTGVVASGTAISVQNDGVTVGSASTINFADNLSVTFSGNVARISGFSTTAAGILKTDTQYTATAGQTTFAATYVVGYVDVYLNGVRLSGSEYTATNGTSIILNDGASLGDIINIVAFSVNLTSVTNSTNVIGGIGSITQLQVTGISTFTNGPVLIGSATSTGTSTQRLQVTGGAYISASTGIGTTNPTAILHIGPSPSTAANNAPLKLSSSTVLVTPEVGAIEYDGSFICQTPNSTSGRAYIPPTYSFRRTTTGSAIGPAIADFFTSPSSLSLEASSAYKIQCFAYFTKTTAGIGTWTQTFSSAPTIAEGYQYMTPVTGMSAATSASYAQLENYFYDQGATTYAWNPSVTTLSTGVNHLYRLDMTVFTNAATNWRLRITQSAGTVTPLAGSYYTVEKIGSSTGIFAA